MTLDGRNLCELPDLAYCYRDLLEDLVSMELYFPISAQPMWVNTIVRYSMARGRSGQCGLQFLSVTDDQPELIKRYCQLQPKEKPRRWL